MQPWAGDLVEDKTRHGRKTLRDRHDPRRRRPDAYHCDLDENIIGKPFAGAMTDVSGAAAGPIDDPDDTGHYESDSTDKPWQIDGGSQRGRATLQGLHRERVMALVLTTFFLYRLLTHLDHHLPSYLLYEG